jgi:hypothetical protein
MPRPVSIFEPTPKERGAFSGPPSDPALLTAQDEPSPVPEAARHVSRIPEPQPPYAESMVSDPLHLSSPVELQSRLRAVPHQRAAAAGEWARAQTEPGSATLRRPEAIRPTPEPAPTAADTDTHQPSPQPSSPPARKPPDKMSAPRPAAEAVASNGLLPAAPEPRLRPGRTRLLPEMMPQEPIRDRPSQPWPIAVAELGAAVSLPDGDRQRAGSPEPATPSPEQAPTPRLPTSVVVRPQIAAIASAELARSAPFAPGSTAESMPTIQVTIGRVEVRATPLPPAPQKPRSGPPVMTLDEYLRQRTQGGQR